MAITTSNAALAGHGCAAPEFALNDVSGQGHLALAVLKHVKGDMEKIGVDMAATLVFERQVLDLMRSFGAPGDFDPTHKRARDAIRFWSSVMQGLVEKHKEQVDHFVKSWEAILRKFMTAGEDSCDVDDPPEGNCDGAIGSEAMGVDESEDEDVEEDEDEYEG